MKIEKYIEKLKQIEGGGNDVMLPYNIIRKMEFLQGSIYVSSLRELLEEVLKTYDVEEVSPDSEEKEK